MRTAGREDVGKSPTPHSAENHPRGCFLAAVGGLKLRAESVELVIKLPYLAQL